ncbi:hypothetical protein CARN8_6010008 [mine drainage metagenome]|uniref:Uncharacterized protein n=1 Tax=mine drainage metagenome TaxID=410659 RepID=A0A3P3ZRK7_9ZZZZ
MMMSFAASPLSAFGFSGRLAMIDATSSRAFIVNVFGFPAIMFVLIIDVMPTLRHRVQLYAPVLPLSIIAARGKHV